jgi:6,7-dimethyl-8-ribityllumazine synthase
LPEERFRLLIVEARFYEPLSDALLKGAVDAITAAGADFDVVSVPGSLEVPAAVAMAEEGGHRPAGLRYDGYVALGCVIRSHTSAFEVFANQSARGLMELAVGRRLAIGSGMLAVEDERQALLQASPDKEDRGGAAARACLQMIALRRRLLGQSR